MMLILSSIIAFIGIYSLVLTTSNLLYFRSLSKHWEKHTSKELVTIAVPARNEEATIEACLRSLMAQSYAHLEILVLDDNSEDNTAAIVRKLETEDSRLHLITGRALQEGWRGKLWAMEQLFRQSNGTYLFFTDADTVHKQDSIAYGMSLLSQRNAALLSGYPKQQTKSLGIGLLVSAMLFNPTLFVPFALQERLQLPLFSMAIGQYILLKKEALDAIGGFSSLRTEICDDVTLARAFARKGFKQMFAPMTDVVECEMFPTFKGAFSGLERSINGVVKRGLIGFLMILLIVIVLLALAVAPLLTLGLAILSFSNTAYLLPALWLFLGSLTLWASWAWAAKRFAFSTPVAMLGHVTIFLVVLMYLHGAYLRSTGRGFIWKGRVLP
ncbi:MAG: glycosyltransferase family 2 protein [Sphaerochaeta sp.]|uniref:glycosyltransferase n=1 Tax=Sphaerochaeta sp. TaxID=1972642 RepID=UPI002A28405D|nr:glycosyltransferase family 2 protein [Sphaerochaeta sp.]